MNVITTTHPAQNIEIEAVTIHNAETMRELRDDPWTEGALAVLTYPTAAPVGYLSYDNPKVLGRMVQVGDTILKGPAGDFEVVSPDQWWG